MMIQDVIQNYLNSIHYDKPVMVKGYNHDDEITIYTRNPGYLIGYKGEAWNKLVNELKEVTHNNKLRVNIVEIQEIICGNNAKIDTRPWAEIREERVLARMSTWGM